MSTAYYGALRGSPHKWLDLEGLCRRLLPDDDIRQIRYFTAWSERPVRRELRTPTESADDPSRIFEEGSGSAAAGGKTPKFPSPHHLQPRPMERDQGSATLLAHTRPDITSDRAASVACPYESVDEEPQPGNAIPMHEHFELAEDWPGMVEPDFNLS